MRWWPWVSSSEHESLWIENENNKDDIRMLYDRKSKLIGEITRLTQHNNVLLKELKQAKEKLKKISTVLCHSPKENK